MTCGSCVVVFMDVFTYGTDICSISFCCTTGRGNSTFVAVAQCRCKFSAAYCTYLRCGAGRFCARCMFQRTALDGVTYGTVLCQRTGSVYPDVVGCTGIEVNGGSIQLGVCISYSYSVPLVLCAGKVNCFDCCAGNYIFPDICQGRMQGKFFQQRAVCQSIVADRSNTGRDIDAFKSLTAVECAAAYALHTIRNMDGSQGRT